MIWTPNVSPGEQQVAGRRVRRTRQIVSPFRNSQSPTGTDSSASSWEGVDELHVGGRRRALVGDQDDEAHGVAGRDPERIVRPRGTIGRIADEVAVGVHLDDQLLDAQVGLGAHRHEGGGGVVAGVAVVDRRTSTVAVFASTVPSGTVGSTVNSMPKNDADEGREAEVGRRRTSRSVRSPASPVTVQFRNGVRSKSGFVGVVEAHEGHAGRQRVGERDVGRRPTVRS